MRVKKLLGILALDVNAKEIGKISDLDFDSETGKINQIAVTLKKNILSNDELLFDYAEIKSVGDYVLLDTTVTKENPTVEVDPESESESQKESKPETEKVNLD